ncbi:hypothetical protein V8G54_019999 [Vigna mungo]|uniref:Uncharacterized protein n=1 Tax=Vigna mungo TaxID=3915 RepID=A0AAQ3NEP9_VIGMU
MKWPLESSTQCHPSRCSSFSTLLPQTMQRTLSSSTSTRTSLRLYPGRCALYTCASGVSLNSMWELRIGEGSAGKAMKGGGGLDCVRPMVWCCWAWYGSQVG